MSLSKVARTSGLSPGTTDIAAKQQLRTRPAGLLPALPPDALLHVLSLLEPADVAAAAEAFPEEVGAVTRADWAWGPLWRGKRFQAEDVDEVLAVVRAAPPCDKATLYVGWPLPAMDTTNNSTGIVSLVFGAANRRVTVLCDLRANLERILGELSLRAKETTVCPYEPLPRQLALERPILRPDGYLEAARLFWNRSYMAAAIAESGAAGLGHACRTQLDWVQLRPSALWTVLGASAGALRSAVLRYDPRVAAAIEGRPFTRRAARGLWCLDGIDSPWKLDMCFPRRGSAASADSLMLTDDEVVEVTTARKSLDYDALNNNKSALVQAGRSPLSRQDSSSDEEFLYLVLTCCDCKDLFPTSYQLLLHRLDAHSDRRAYQCPACMATFKRPDLLAEHRATHTESQPHACEHCDARFTLKSHVKAHSRAMHPEHHQPQQHQCSACSGVFQSAAGLASHMRCHAEAGLRGTPKPFVCKKCDCRFKQRSNLNSHTRRSHPIAVESTGAKE